MDKLKSCLSRKVNDVYYSYTRFLNNNLRNVRYVNNITISVMNIHIRVPKKLTP